MVRHALLGCAIAALALLWAPTAPAGPAIAIVIDDMGYSLDELSAVLALDAPVAIAVLPDTPHAAAVAEGARAAKREVLLHQPMAPRGPNRSAGARALTLEMSARELDRMLAENLAAVPGAVGVNGHMGSLLTTHADPMRELMRLLRQHGGLYFVDSYTHPQSVALRQARRHGLPATRRDVFLDHDPREPAVRAQLDRLRRLARERGSALAIGHPGTPTLRILRTALPALREEGFELIAVSELIVRQRQFAERTRGGSTLAGGSEPLTLPPDPAEKSAGREVSRRAP